MNWSAVADVWAHTAAVLGVICLFVAVWFAGVGVLSGDRRMTLRAVLAAAASWLVGSLAWGWLA